MPNQEGTVSFIVYDTWEDTNDFILHEVIKADELSSDDRCAICHQPYETPDEDGNTPEHAVRFPCGHDIGDACLRMWIEEASSELRCMFCNKSVIPARYLLEQVEEIWTIVNKMSPEEIRNELKNITTRGPLSYAILPILAYFEHTPPLSHFKNYNEGLAPSFDWLLIASKGFCAAVLQYADISRRRVGSHKLNLKTLERRKHEFKLNYDRFEIMVKRTWVERANKPETEGTLCIKSPWTGIWRFW